MPVKAVFSALFSDKSHLVWIVAVFIIIQSIGLYRELRYTYIEKKGMSTSWENQLNTPRNSVDSNMNITHDTVRTKKIYLISWFSKPAYVDLRPDSNFLFSFNFDQCQYKNCEMTVNWTNEKERQMHTFSDLVIFDGRAVPNISGFIRPQNQIWVFHGMEPPVYYGDCGNHWPKPQWRGSFNWSMTYDQPNTDIYLPHGKIMKKSEKVYKNYTTIFSEKNKSALIIFSHCDVSSQRSEYVKLLQKYMPIEMLGGCSGKKWDCGRHFVHDVNCFKILNKYSLYLAFENSLCSHYFTEKLFENYNFDTVLIIRGGNDLTDVQSLLPPGTYVSTDEYKSTSELGKHLNKLMNSEKEYTKILSKKDEYYSSGFTPVYITAMCELCKRLNNQNEYRKTIKHPNEWVINKCRQPTDIKE